MLTWLRQAFHNGDITEEQFDMMLDDIMQQEDLDNDMETAEVKRSYADLLAEEKRTRQYSFSDSSTGMANDLLLPYEGELREIIENNGGIIVDSYDKLKAVVNLAFDRPNLQTTAYFGIVNSDLLQNIENSIRNLPKVLRGKLFKPGRNYSLVATLDSIRHMVDKKEGLTREDVLDYLDRMADTILENDSVYFDYYTDSYNNRLNGLVFKKQFADGVIESFEIVSKKKMSMNMQTLFMDKASYQKKKAAETLPMQNASAHTPKAGVSQPSNKMLSQSEDDVNKKFSFSESVSRGSVMADLKGILARGGDPAELRQYVAQMEQNRPAAEQTGRNTDQTTREAEQILQSAKRQGVSVDEYLRWNWEQYDADGRWNDAARKALEMEKGNRQYSISSSSAENGSIKKQMTENQERLNGMDPVASVIVPKGFFEWDKIKKQNWAIEKLQDTGYQVERAGFGLIEFAKKRIKSAFNYFRKGSVEEVVFEALPFVLENGVEISERENHKGREYGTVTIAAPITVNGIRGNMAAVVKRTTGNFYKVHRILSPDGSTYLLSDIKEEAESTPGGGVTENSPLAAPIDFASSNNILDTVGGVNNQFSIHDPGEIQEGGRVRDGLNYKAKDYLARAERKLLRDIGGMMNAHRFADRSYLQETVREISDEYLRSGTISEESKAQLFDDAYKRGIVVDTQFYEQYKEIKKYLRSTAVTLSARDQPDIVDFDDFKKRAFGTLRIVKDGGLPVDTAYDELHSMAPELFPESITHPADQLVRMFDVGRSIVRSEKTLKEYHSADAQDFYKWAKMDFDAVIGDVARELQTVKRYADEKAASDAEDARKAPANAEEAMEAYNQMKQSRRAYEKTMAKHLLSEHDEMQVGRLLKGELLPEHLDPERDNVKGITAVYEAKRDYEQWASVLAAYKRQLRGKHRDLADGYLETANEWKDKKVGILYSRETMRRNIQDIVADPQVAEQINREYFEAVSVAEAEATRFKNEYRDKVRALNLSTKPAKGDMVSEAHAVQLLGEVEDNIRALENARGRLRQKEGKTLAEWRDIKRKLWEESPSLDRDKIDSAVKEFRWIYDQLFQQMNMARVRNGYEPVNYRKGYFPHFQPGDGDGVIAQFGKILGINTQVAALPTTINGLTHTFKPGIQWFGNAQERLGFNTAYDAVEGFDKYIEGVASVIHQTDNIQKLRALATQVRYRTSDEGIRRQVDAVNENPRLTEEEKQVQIAAIYEHGKFALSNFVVELDEYTNLLANKKSKLDRTMEGLLGRRAYTVMKNIESRVGANMIAGNLSSALTNFIPLTQAGAQLDRGALLRGMWSALQSYRQDDGIVGKSAFLTNRRGSDPLVKNWAQKASEVLGMPMELIDTFVSDSVVRAAYFQNLKRGLSEEEAMHQADVFAAGVIADRSKGSMPTLFESTNPIFKAFTQFQLEVNNQFSEVFKDLPRGFKEKGVAALAIVLLKYFLGAFLFNEAYEYFIGRRPALDPIDMLNNTVGDLTGYELPNVLELGEGIITGDMPEFTAEKVSIGEAGTNLATGALEELPFSSGLGLLGVELDGGRIPVSSAIPDLNAMWQAATNTEWSGRKRWKEAQDELNKLAYVIPPFGGNQASKIIKGLKAYFQGGSYNVTAEGERILQYPVFKDEPGDAFWNLVRSAVMGKSALPEAQEWVDSGFDSLSEKQTTVYQGLLDAGVNDREAYGFIRDLEKITKTDEESEAVLKRKALRGSGLSDDGKAVVYYGLLASKETRELIDQMDAQGADVTEVSRVLMEIQDAKDSNEKREILAGAKLTDGEKQTLYTKKVSDNRDDDISAFRVAGMDFDTFLEVNSEYARIDKTAGSASKKALDFAHWVNERQFSDAQKNVILDSFKYYSMAPANVTRYNDMVNAGVDYDDAYELSTEIAMLEPEEGKTSVADVQRWRLCVDFSDNQQMQMAALMATMQPAQYTKVEIAHNLGVAPADYVKLKEILPQYDTDGNGSYKRAEIKAAIDSMTGCSREQKAVLWQLTVASNTKAGSNPYGQSMGQRVIDARTAAKANEEPASGGSFEDAITSQW